MNVAHYDSSDAPRDIPSPGMERSSKAGPAYWAGLSAEAAMAALGACPAGLNQAEAAARLGCYGPNSLPRPSRRRWYAEFASGFVHLFALLLWAGAALAWVAGMPQLAWAIVAVVVVNGVFSYWQEYQAERAVEALAALLPRQVMVRRDALELLVPAETVVPGDMLVLTDGEAIPADARVVRAERLRLDTSSLTGESRPVPRTANRAEVAGRTTAVLSNLVLAGTTVASGRGEAVVFATGSATEFGRIAELTGAQNDRPSPLQLELVRVTRLVTLLAVAMGVAFFTIGTLLGGLSPASGLLFAIGIVVANVPEGMLPTLTLALALGVRRMASRNALVKRLSAVETLGATTIILSDKTGTLTENEMTVRDAWTGGLYHRLSEYEVPGASETAQPARAAGGSMALVGLLRTAALCCDARLIPEKDRPGQWKTIGDPTEVAILVAAERVGISQDALTASPRLAELPFDSVRKRMTTIRKIAGQPVACVKGAPNEILPRCTKIRWDGSDLRLDAGYRQIADEAWQQMSRHGLRVLAVAVRNAAGEMQSSDGWTPEEVEQDLTLLGLLAMEDPPRREVPAAIAACRRAGVRAVMITGDDGLTAAAIGREIGLHDHTPHIVTGAELDKLSEEEIVALFDDDDLLFARVEPEHKLQLVKACQQRGEVVAVTGDGVNDAPALKRADIGVAMGETGTDVAREAADMVLADDNFASIVAAIEEGRAVYDNVRKFVTYIFASNVPEIVPFAAFVLFRIPLPLTVMQILAVDIGTDLVPAIALGAEAPEPEIMSRRPRPRSERLLNPATLLRAYGWLGMIEAGLSLGGYFFVYWLAGWRPGLSLEKSGSVYVLATTMSLAGIVACQVGNVFACRSIHRSIWQRGLKINRLLFLGIAVELTLLVLLVYAHPLQAVFGLSPLSYKHWLLLASFGPLLLLLEESRKAIARHWKHAERSSVRSDVTLDRAG